MNISNKLSYTEIARVRGHCAVHSHLRSLTLVPTKRPYASSYYWTTLTSYLAPFSSYDAVLIELSRLTGVPLL